jgi:hypothetical protein
LTTVPFQPQRVGGGEERARTVDDALRQPVVIAEINEKELAVIALAMDPARKPRRRARIRASQRAAMMRPVGVHSLKSACPEPSGERG